MLPNVAASPDFREVELRGLGFSDVQGPEGSVSRLIWIIRGKKV